MENTQQQSNFYDPWLDQKLSDREALLSKAEQIAHMGSFVWDVQSQQVGWSDGMYQILGLEPGSVKPSVERFDQAVHPDDQESFFAIREKVLSSGQAPVVAVRLVRANGEVRDVLINGEMIENEAGVVVRSVGTVLDVTERKALESQLHQSQKLEVVGRLASGVAHDFNNLLSGILGYSGLLEDSLTEEGSEELAKMANNIHVAAERAGAVTSRLLSFSRKQSLDRTPCNVHNIINETATLLRASVGPQIEIKLQCNADESWVLANAASLQSALLNLAINARDAIVGRGTIEIATALVELNKEAAQALNCPCEAGSHLMISLTDNGSGIESEVKERLFEPFFTTKSPGLGTGLGLPAVYSSVCAHSGGLGIESQVGKGSTFKIYLPQIESGALKKTPTQQGEYRTGNILIIDDDKTVRQVLQVVLERAGHKVTVADSTSSGITSYKESSPRPDLVILDVLMPTGSGWDVIPEIRKIDKSTQILVVSGFVGETPSEKFQNTNADYFIRKPFQNARLLKEVGMLLAKQKSLAEV